MPRHQLSRAIERVLREHAPDTIPGFRAVCAGTHIANEADAMVYARWVSEHGHLYGFRPPTVDERVRSTGQEAYLHALNLSQRDLFDLTGNHFDCSAIQTVVAPLLRDWVYLRRVPGWTYPAPAFQASLLASLGETVHRHYPNLALQQAPWPNDLNHFAQYHNPATHVHDGRPPVVGLAEPSSSRRQS